MNEPTKPVDRVRSTRTAGSSRTFRCMSRRAVVVAITAWCLAAAVSACDSGPSIDPDADEELIEDALLSADDLPDGFEEVEVDDEDESSLGAACNDEVLGIDRDALEDETSAEAGPVQFDDTTLDVSVRAETTAYESDDEITRIVEGIEDDDYADCLAENLEDELDQGTRLVELEAIDSPFDERDTVVGAIRVLLEVNSPATSGVVVDIESQQHGVVLDRFAVTLQVTAEEGQIDDDLVEDLLDAMVERLQDGVEDS